MCKAKVQSPAPPETNKQTNKASHMGRLTHESIEAQKDFLKKTATLQILLFFLSLLRYSSLTPTSLLPQNYSGIHV
jgi:hypothetical protein